MDSADRLGSAGISGSASGARGAGSTCGRFYRVSSGNVGSLHSTGSVDSVVG